MRYESRNKKLNRQPGKVKNWIYHRGDIYLANLNPFKGSEQGGTRPVLVLSNDIGNYYSSLITIAPITSQLKKTQQPTHVMLDNVRGLSTESMVCLEQIHAIDKMRILRYLGKISKDQMSAVEDAALESLGMPTIVLSFLSGRGMRKRIPRIHKHGGDNHNGKTAYKEGGSKTAWYQY